GRVHAHDRAPSVAPGETAAGLKPEDVTSTHRLLTLPRAGAGDSDLTRQLREEFNTQSQSGEGSGQQ
ncbi:hypothetical protein LLG95_10385, partial [bacterium]|nr:hypothetical protein [bacterium]